jgi:hypothetical protein
MNKTGNHETPRSGSLIQPNGSTLGQLKSK